MASLHSFSHYLERWRQKYRDRFPSCSLPPHPSALSESRSAASARKADGGKPYPQFQPPLLLGIVVASLTSVVGYRFYNQPQLAVGTVSPVTIVAPRDDRFIDTKTTEAKRREIRTGIVPVLRRDDRVTQEIAFTLREILDRIERVRDIGGVFPFVETGRLSLSTQQYLRSCSEKDWEAILNAVRGMSSESTSSLNAKQQQAIAELERIRQNDFAVEFEASIDQIFLARQRYSREWEELDIPQNTFLSRERILSLLALSDREWQNRKSTLLQTLQAILTQGIPSGMPPELLEETVRMHLSLTGISSERSVEQQLLLAVLKDRHNLTVDREATKRRAEQTAQAVEPVIVEIKRGETVVEAGETISQEDFVILDSFGLSRREVNWIGVAGSGILVIGAIGIFWIVARRVHRPLRRRDRVLLFLLSLSSPLLAILQVPFTPLPAIGLLASSFYSPTLAVTQVSLLTGLTAFAAGTLGWEYLVAGAAGGLLAATMAGRLRSRDELSLLGGGIGLVQGGTYFVVNLIISATAGTIWYAMLPESIVYGLAGIAWSVVALGISPYLERFFDLVTPIRLVELSNPNCPLLKRLALEAPGTFQHTLFVACLAEAAARELHCNVELVRAGTLYHDIGKMHDPLGFIENQMGGPNKHDIMNDPWKSADIIKKHVTEGLEMARRYGLPRVIRDFIPEHQGTLLISYFYFQAKQKAEQNPDIEIADSDFRYDGPIPQSRETGIVMLADGCEAALRSLRDATPEIALMTIKKIFKARWQEKQLVDSGIKYEELPLIAEVFVRVWQQFHHQRIAYPKAALESPTSGK